MGVALLDNFSIQSLKDIQPGQFWAVLPSNGNIYISTISTIQCFDKANRNCSISYAGDYAEVMCVAIDVLKRNELSFEDTHLIVNNLLTRLHKFEDSRCVIIKIIDAIYLWIIGYRGENSLTSMTQSLEAMIHAPIQGLEDEPDDVKDLIRQKGNIIKEMTVLVENTIHELTKNEPKNPPTTQDLSFPHFEMIKTISKTGPKPGLIKSSDSKVPTEEFSLEYTFFMYSNALMKHLFVHRYLKKIFAEKMASGSFKGWSDRKAIEAFDQLFKLSYVIGIRMIHELEKAKDSFIKETKDLEDHPFEGQASQLAYPLFILPYWYNQAKNQADYEAFRVVHEKTKANVFLGIDSTDRHVRFDKESDKKNTDSIQKKFLLNEDLKARYEKEGTKEHSWRLLFKDYSDDLKAFEKSLSKKEKEAIEKLISNEKFVDIQTSLENWINQK
jgi:hypothetical protein